MLTLDNNNTNSAVDFIVKKVKQNKSYTNNKTPFVCTIVKISNNEQVDILKKILVAIQSHIDDIMNTIHNTNYTFTDHNVNSIYNSILNYSFVKNVIVPATNTIKRDLFDKPSLLLFIDAVVFFLAVREASYSVLYRTFREKIIDLCVSSYDQYIALSDDINTSLKRFNDMYLQLDMLINEPTRGFSSKISKVWATDIVSQQDINFIVGVEIKATKNTFLARSIIYDCEY